MRLTKADEAKLAKAHPDLLKVVRRAAEITTCDFRIGECARTLARQRTLVEKGASQTLKSRHLIAPNGFSHAVDLIALVGGAARWDWPLYHKLADAMKQAAKDVNVPIEWGGDWSAFKDGPHFQLPWVKYPGNKPIKAA